MLDFALNYWNLLNMVWWIACSCQCSASTAARWAKLAECQVNHQENQNSLCWSFFKQAGESVEDSLLCKYIWLFSYSLNAENYQDLLGEICHLYVIRWLKLICIKSVSNSVYGTLIERSLLFRNANWYAWGFLHACVWRNLNEFVYVDF